MDPVRRNRGNYSEEVDFRDEENVPLVQGRNQEQIIDDFIVLDAPIEEAIEARNEELQGSSPYLNGSRKRLLTIWGPFQLVSLIAVIWMASLVYGMAPAAVTKHSKQLYWCGVILQGAFIIGVARDLFIFLTMFFQGDHVGFWQALVLHVLFIPLDVLFLLVVGTWGAIVMNQVGTTRCAQDLDCSPFVGLVRTNVMASFSVIFFNIGIKFCLIGFFMFAMGGFQMLIADLEERASWANDQLGRKAYANLQTDSYSKILGHLNQGDTKLSCVICMEDFGDTDKVTMLKCDKRHIYHSECIRRALQQKLECPMCRGKVDLD